MKTETPARKTMTETNSAGAYRFLILLVMMLPSIVCCGIAANIVMTKGGDSTGWVWFLLAGLILGEGPVKVGQGMLETETKQ